MPGVEIELNNNLFCGSFDQVEEAVQYIRSKVKCKLEIGIVCGSGLGRLGDTIEQAITIDYNDIPHFQKSGPGVEGHSGELVVGQLVGTNVMCMKGRFHPYEGYPSWKVGFPIRVMKMLGINGVIITNAAGGMNSTFKVGDFMILNDHIYLPGLMGYSPLIGPNDSRFGPRFPPMSDAYDDKWRTLASDIGKTMNERVHRGIYACVFGPSYETPAEKRFLQLMGADAVGMSTVHEVVTARHCGLRVLAISLITNIVVDSVHSTDVASHAEVLEAGKKRTADMVQYVTEILRQIKSNNDVTNGHGAPFSGL